MNDKRGLDLGPVIDWITDNKAEINRRLEWVQQYRGGTEKPPYVLREKERLLLSEQEISAVIHRYPETARQRSILSVVSGQAPAWFHKDSTKEEPFPTDKVEEALCPTSIIPGYIRYPTWTPEKKEAEIWLYQLEGVPVDVARVILIYTLLHEYCHTLVAELFYNETYRLLWGSEQREITGLEVMTEFAKLATKYSPISHYSSIYWPLPTEPEDPRFYVSVSEEMCDTVAAHLLRFMYCDDEKRRLNPLADRPEVKAATIRFLETCRAS